jgi:transposase
MTYRKAIQYAMVMVFRRRGHSVAEISKYSKIPKSTIYRWLRHG